MPLKLDKKKTQNKKEPSFEDQLSPKHKKLWNYVLENHPWIIRDEESKTDI
jgi:hypothetical protein